MRNSTITRYLQSLVIVFLLSILLAPAYATDEKLPDSFLWGIRTPRGTGYTMNLSLLKLWEEELGIKCITTQVASSVAAFPKMKNRRIDIFKTGMRDAYLANHGLNEYKGKKHNIRLFGLFIDTNLAFVAIPGSGVKKIEDLAGRTITYTSKRAVTMTEFGNSLLEFYKIKDKVNNIANLAMKEKHEALIEKRVDASLEGLENVQAIWRDNKEAYYLPVSKEASDYVASKHPWFALKVAEPGWRMYKENYTGVGPGFDYPVSSITTPYGAFVDASLSEYLVYMLLKTTFDNYDKLVNIHPVFKDYPLENMVMPNTLVPYHPGAIKFMKEKGLWSPELESNQNKLLSELGQ